MNKKPILNICGEPNSNYSEIIIKSFKKFKSRKPILLIGSHNLMLSQLKKMKIKTEDKIVQAVLRKMDERSLVGQKKYGATMMQEIKNQDKDLNRFLVDVQEELMDALLYIEAAKRCLQDEVEEVMLKQSNKDNYDLHYFNEAWNIKVDDPETL